MHVPAQALPVRRLVPQASFLKTRKFQPEMLGGETCLLEAASSRSGFLLGDRVVAGASRWAGASGVKSMPCGLRSSHALGLRPSTFLRARGESH